MLHGIFRTLQPFNYLSVGSVPSSPGVYVIYDMAGPIYVGRSKTDIHKRLLCHLLGRGNRNIAMAMRINAALTFEYECMASPQQAEAVLIQRLGVNKFANLRRETDPADLD